MAQHTKNAIRRGFMELLSQRPFDRISVVDIAQHCEINRNTFYYYYEDIFALVEDVLDTERKKIREEYEGGSSMEQIYLRCTDFIRRNKRAITHLVNSSNRERLDRYFFRSTLDVMTGMVRKMSRGRSISESELERIALYHTAALIGLERAWVLGGMKEGTGECLQSMGPMLEASIRTALEQACRCA